MGQSHQECRGHPQDATMVRRASIRAFPKRSDARAGRHRHDRKVGRERRTCHIEFEWKFRAPISVFVQNPATSIKSIFTVCSGSDATDFLTNCGGELDGAIQRCAIFCFNVGSQILKRLYLPCQCIFQIRISS